NANIKMYHNPADPTDQGTGGGLGYAFNDGRNQWGTANSSNTWGHFGMLKDGGGTSRTIWQAQGWGTVGPPPSGGRGETSMGQTITLGQISDGTSNTMLLSEKWISCNYYAWGNYWGPVTLTWAGGSTFDSNTLLEAAAPDQCKYYSYDTGRYYIQGGTGGTFQVGMADGSVQRARVTMSRAPWRARCTPKAADQVSTFP